MFDQLEGKTTVAWSYRLKRKTKPGSGRTDVEFEQVWN